MLLRSLLRDLFWRPEYRSRREKVGHYIYGLVIALTVVVAATYYEWFDSRLSRILWIVLGGLVLHSAGWLAWLFWGRRRFPLPTSDGSKSTA